MAAPGTYFSEFDYTSAYGANPFAEPTKQIGDYVNRLFGASAPPAGTSSSSSGGTSASWGTNIASPEDPEVQDYMDHILGGQRQTLDDYVRQAAGAGIKRGGMNVVGGPTLDSSLHHMAMDTLAKGYSNRFGEAMGYNKYLKGALYSQYQDNTQNLQNMLGMQHRYLSSQSDWQNQLGNVMHGDWKGDVDWTRDEPKRDLELSRLKDQVDMDRWKNEMERADRTTAAYEKLDQENQWGNMAQKYGQAYTVGKFGAGWTWADDLNAERLGVGMGYLKPWQRSFQVKQQIG